MDAAKFDYMMKRVDGIVDRKLNGLRGLLDWRKRREPGECSPYDCLLKQYYETESGVAKDNELDLIHGLLDRALRDGLDLGEEDRGVSLRLYADVDEPFVAVYALSSSTPRLRIGLPHLKRLRSCKVRQELIGRRMAEKAYDKIMEAGRNVKDRIVLESRPDRILRILHELETLDVPSLLASCGTDENHGEDVK